MPTEQTPFEMRMGVITKVMDATRTMAREGKTAQDVDDWIYKNQLTLANGTTQRVRKPKPAQPKQQAASLPLESK